MSDEVHNIHDAFSRKVFSDPVRAVAFFEQFLPASLLKAIDLSTLKVSKESYIPKSLKEYFSDLVFAVNLKKESKEVTHLALLFEHKSEPDKNVLLQVGHYMFSHWMTCIRKKKPAYPIIPIIYYQGSKKWEIPVIKTLFAKYPDSIKHYLPDIPNIFLPLKDIPEEKILEIRDAIMVTAILAQRSKIHPIELAEDFLRILSLFPHDAGDRNFFETLIVYTYRVSNIADDQMTEVLQQLPQPIKYKVMTTYEMIKNKGKQEGKIEGKLEGKLEGKIEVIIHSFKNEYPIPEIAKITNMPTEEVQKILKDNRLI